MTLFKILLFMDEMDRGTRGEVATCFSILRVLART